MDRDTVQLPSSPTNTSPTSTDLDTESTGSFFPDRSTTLGTLMGLTFPEIDVCQNLTPLNRHLYGEAFSSGHVKKKEKGRRRRRGGGSWWRLCRDEAGTTSLEEFLKAERQGATAESGFVSDAFVAEKLFENGRILPPVSAAAAAAEGSGGEFACANCCWDLQQGRRVNL